MPASGICQFPFAHTLICCRFAYSIMGSRFGHPSIISKVAFRYFPFMFSKPFIAFVISGYFRLFPFTLYKYTLEPFSSVFALFYAFTQFMEHITVQFQGSILNRTFQLTPCTANTALLSADPCSPGRSLCSCVLLPYRFLKCVLSDVPPEIDHLTGSRQQLPCL